MTSAAEILKWSIYIKDRKYVYIIICAFHNPLNADHFLILIKLFFPRDNKFIYYYLKQNTSIIVHHSQVYKKAMDAINAKDVPDNTKKQHGLSRSDSFSSCSSDSAVYCSVRHIQNAKYETRNGHDTLKHSESLIKRHRNSSSSSLSSNLSCTSDKDAKKSNISNLINSSISKTLPDYKISINKQTDYPLSKTSAASIASNLKVQSVLKEELGFTKSVSVIKHNLRQNIRKKTCTCDCSHSSFIVRRFSALNQNVDKHTSKLKAVVSSSKQDSLSSNFPKSSPKTKTYVPKKRRSEMDKLYDDLHQIKWAQHFSPDNILCPINFRRTTACSTFTQKSKVDKSKRTDLNEFCLDSNKGSSNNHFPESSDKCIQDLAENEESMSNYINISSVEQNLIQNHNYLCKSNSNEKIDDLNLFDDSSHLPNADISEISKAILPINRQLQILKASTKAMDAIANTLNCSSNMTLNYDSYYDVRSCKKKCLSQNIPNNDNNFSQITSDINESDKSFNESEDSLSLKNDYRNSSEIVEQAINSNFLNISDDEIQNIDPCVREVVAEEIVISSNSNNSLELPHLKCINDFSSSDKALTLSEFPPKLDLCASPPFSKWDSSKELDTLNQDFFCISNCLNNTVLGVKKLDNPKRCYIDSSADYFKPFNKKLKLRTLKNVCKFQQNNVNKFKSDLVAKYILKKYRKYYVRCIKNKNQSKVFLNKDFLKNNKSRKLNHAPLNNIVEDFEKNSFKNEKQTLSTQIFVSEASCMIVTNRDEHLTSSNISHLEIPDNSSETNLRCDKMLVNKISSCYNNKCAFLENHASSNLQEESLKSTSLSTKSFSSIQLKSLSCEKSLSLYKDKGNHKIQDEKLQKPLLLPGFICHYKSITVNRNGNYIQVALKITRGNSVFLTIETLRELRDAVKRAGDDESCRVLIVNGTNDSFCLGLDLKPFVESCLPANTLETAIAIKELIEALMEFKKPFVAAVNGKAFGLGVTLLTHADVSIASNEATFRMPYVYLGYSPEGGASLTLPQVVGSTVAMDMLLRGRILTAQEACQRGLVSEVLKADYMSNELMSRIKTLTQSPPSVIENTKTMARLRMYRDLHTVLQDEVDILPRMWLSKPCQEALHNAFKTGLIPE